jgi:hypothetical protein
VAREGDEREEEIRRRPSVAARKLPAKPWLTRKGKIQGSCGTSTRGRWHEDMERRRPFPSRSPFSRCLCFFSIHGATGPVGQPAYTAPPTRLKRVWPAGLRCGFAQRACGKARPAFIYTIGAHFFSFFSKFYRCQVSLANCWRCSCYVRNYEAILAKFVKLIC